MNTTLETQQNYKTLDYATEPVITAELGLVHPWIQLIF